MSKHTPGPWRVDGRFVVAMKEKTVCECPSDGIQHTKVDQANARLIAAAPDLLAALTSLMEVLRGDGVLSEVIRDSNFWDRAMNAIAKAEGQQP